jgi:predicted nucleic acid-binding protein
MDDRIALDANVLVGWLDASDLHATRTHALLTTLRELRLRPVLVDFVVAETLSVLARRARERKTTPPDLKPVFATIRSWRAQLYRLSQHTPRLWDEALNVVEATNGRLNFNDALLVALQREGAIGWLATFDKGFEQVDQFAWTDGTVFVGAGPRFNPRDLRQPPPR